jgi:DNA-binding MarR family transcriptional regulator
MTEKTASDIFYDLQKIFILLDDGDRRVLQQFDLTPTQYNLLKSLGTEVEIGKTITELADVLLCTRGNATRLVKRLQQSNFVQIGKDPNDQRLVRVALTPEGAARFTEARTAHWASIQRRIGALELQTQQTLAEYTQNLIKVLEADLARHD